MVHTSGITSDTQLYFHKLENTNEWKSKHVRVADGLNRDQLVIVSRLSSVKLAQCKPAATEDKKVERI